MKIEFEGSIQEFRALFSNLTTRPTQGPPTNGTGLTRNQKAKLKAKEKRKAAKAKQNEAGNHHTPMPTVTPQNGSGRKQQPSQRKRFHTQSDDEMEAEDGENPSSTQSTRSGREKRAKPQ